MKPPRVLRIFISSPGDLTEERNALRALIERLDAEFRDRGVGLEALMWESTMPRVLGYPPQELVNYYLGRASQTDVFIGMFWTRLGSEAVVEGERHPSGTVYELRDAYRRWRRGDRPLILLCRSMRPVPGDVDPEQLRALSEFFREWLPSELPELGELIHEFHDLDEMLRQMEVSLRALAASSLEVPRQQLQSFGTPLATAELRRLLDGIEAFLDSYDESQVRGRDGIEGLPLSWCERAEDGGLTPMPHRPLLELFDDRGSRLLLVGGAGRGKTFAMRRLMRDLADRTRRRGTGLVPVYFNLAAWSETQGSANGRWSWRDMFGGVSRDDTLDGWLIDELVRRYGLSRTASRRLVDNRQIIVCLDGLDELRIDDQEESEFTNELRTSCVRRINRTLADQSVAMVVCCRDETFQRIAEKPQLGRPLEVQPLTAEQSRVFLARFADLDGLRRAMEHSPLLRERVRTPLFLEYVSVAYAHMSEAAIIAATSKSPAEWESHLLDHYVSKRLALASGESLTKTAILRCLSWLARRNEPDFLLEDLQPDSLESLPAPNLPGPIAARIYAILSATALSIILAICTALPGALAIGIEWTVAESLPVGVSKAVSLATLSFVTVVIATFPAFRTRNWLWFGFVLGTIFAVVRFFVLWWTPPQNLGGGWDEAVRGGLITWPCAVGVFCLFGVFTLGRICRHQLRYCEKPGIERYEIQPLESFDWHWVDPHDWRRGGWVGLCLGPLVGLAFYLPFGAARGVAFGILATAFVMIFAGLSGTGLRVSYQPNQSIIRSFRHALAMSLLFSLVGAVACGAAYGAKYGVVPALVNGTLGLACSFMVLAFGGIPVVRHVCLGQVLAWQGNLPSFRCIPPWRHTIRFLDDLVRYKLLRRSAGGYAFRHDSLREHFREPRRT